MTDVFAFPSRHARHEPDRRAPSILLVLDGDGYITVKDLDKKRKLLSMHPGSTYYLKAGERFIVTSGTGLSTAEDNDETFSSRLVFIQASVNESAAPNGSSCTLS